VLLIVHSIRDSFSLRENELGANTDESPSPAMSIFTRSDDSSGNRVPSVVAGRATFSQSTQWSLVQHDSPL
jgi:hypothetical protein